MDIQFLGSWDVEWQPSPKQAEDGADSPDPQHGDPACSVGGDSQEEGCETVATDLSQKTAQILSLSILQSTQPNPSATTAGYIASAEDRLLRFALLISKQDLISLNGEECHGEACFPTAGSSGTQSSDSPEVKCDISDIVSETTGVEISPLHHKPCYGWNSTT